MQDERGLFYYPYPSNRRVRMYVQSCGPDILFRMWSADDDTLWEQHGWAPYGAIREASAIYRKKGGFDPKQAYDIQVARALIQEHETPRKPAS